MTNGEAKGKINVVIEKVHGRLSFRPWLGGVLPFDIYSRDGTHIWWFQRTIEG